MSYYNILNVLLSDKQINELQQYINEKNMDINKIPQILDTNKEYYNLYEKCIYDIAMFQFKQLNINYNDNNHYIEYWSSCEIQLNNFKINCDEEELETNNIFIKPILSNILYLKEVQFPTCLTNIDEEKLLYKDFDKEDKIVLTFPKKNKLISFNSKNCYGTTNIFSENTSNIETSFSIMINLWDRKINRKTYKTIENVDSKENIKDIYDGEIYEKKKNNFYKKTENVIEIKKSNDDIDTIYIEDIFNEDIIEDLIYNKKNALCLLGKIIEGSKKNDYSTFIVKKKENKKLVEKKYSDDKYSNNKLYQRFFIKNIFSKEICKWILNEILNNENDVEKKTNYNKEIYKLPFYKLVIIYLQKLLDNMVELYNLENININVDKIYISKNNYNQSEKKDEGKLTINILLNDIVNEIIFEDGIKYKQEVGDTLYYSGELMKYNDKFPNVKYSLFFILLKI